MKIRAILATITLALGLAGCFTSDKPLFTDAEATAPFMKIAFAEQGSKDTTSMTRTGKAYVSKKKDGTLTLRLKQIEGDLYVAELAGDKDGAVQRLYAILQLDRAAKTATTYKAVAAKTDIGPGLRDCKDSTVCIDSLDAYIALGKAAIAAKAKPDTVYRVTLD